MKITYPALHVQCLSVILFSFTSSVTEILCGASDFRIERKHFAPTSMQVSFPEEYNLSPCTYPFTKKL